MPDPPLPNIFPKFAETRTTATPAKSALLSVQTSHFERKRQLKFENGFSDDYWCAGRLDQRVRLPSCPLTEPYTLKEGDSLTLET